MPWTAKQRRYFHAVAEGRVKSSSLSQAEAARLAKEADSMPVLPPVKKKPRRR